MTDANERVAERGYLYVAVGRKYLAEAATSARSLRRFTNLPIQLITDDPSFQSEWFTHVKTVQAPRDFAAKIVGMRHTMFERTVFLDSDTFVCAPIDDLFDALDLFDMSMLPDPMLHSYAFWRRYNPSYKLRYEAVIPEYNTGVISYRWTPAVRSLFADWERLHEELHVKADMPSFREAYLRHVASVRISPLPLSYNFHGIRSFGLAHTEIRVLHERLGERWNTLTALPLSFEDMDVVAKRLNRNPFKRVIVPYLGVIPATLSPYSVKQRVKRLLGVRRTKKAETL